VDGPGYWAVFWTITAKQNQSSLLKFPDFASLPNKLPCKSFYDGFQAACQMPPFMLK
jgi:hypothetical protein